MKKILLIFSIYTGLTSCNDTGSAVRGKSETDSIGISKTKQSVTPDTNKATRDTVQIKQTKNELAHKILGTWAFVGTENATFVIEEKGIYYPETFASYKYMVVGDSIKIHYDGYVGSYLIKMSSPDTLILRGDEEQVYYRFKD